MNFVERVGGSGQSDGIWNFQLEEKFNGGFGGTNGGLLAGLCVHAARTSAPGRMVVGVDARFIRSFSPGAAKVIPTVLNHGRTLTTVSVDILTAEDKIATRGTVSLVAPEALSDLDLEVEGEDVDFSSLKTFEEGKAWRQPKGHRPIPLIDTFAPRYLGRSETAMATATKVIWDDMDASAEAACVAADISVGPPVASALKGKPLAIPNPDLSLRFTGKKLAGDHLLSICRLTGIVGGLATTEMQVYSGEELIATGVSTTTCLKG